jgi:hypothetical protein
VIEQATKLGRLQVGLSQLDDRTRTKSPERLGRPAIFHESAGDHGAALREASQRRAEPARIDALRQQQEHLRLKAGTARATQHAIDG